MNLLYKCGGAYGGGGGRYHQACSILVEDGQKMEDGHIEPKNDGNRWEEHNHEAMFNRVN